MRNLGLLLLGALVVCPHTERVRGHRKEVGARALGEMEWWTIGDLERLRETEGRSQSAHFLSLNPHFTWRELPQVMEMQKRGLQSMGQLMRLDEIGIAETGGGVEVRPVLMAGVGNRRGEPFPGGDDTANFLRPLFSPGVAAMRLGTAWVGLAMADLVFVPQLGVSLPLEAPSPSFPGKIHSDLPVDEESWDPFIPQMVRGVFLPVVIPEPSILWMGAVGLAGLFGWGRVFGRVRCGKAAGDEVPRG